MEFDGCSSMVAVTTAGVFQGSVLCCPEFIVNRADLHLLLTLNRLSKYANDSYLLIGSYNADTVHKELQHILLLASEEQPLRLVRWWLYIGICHPWHPMHRSRVE